MTTKSNRTRKARNKAYKLKQKSKHIKCEHQMKNFRSIMVNQLRNIADIAKAVTKTQQHMGVVNIANHLDEDEAKLAAQAPKDLKTLLENVQADIKGFNEFCQTEFTVDDAMGYMINNSKIVMDYPDDLKTALMYLGIYEEAFNAWRKSSADDQIEEAVIVEGDVLEAEDIEQTVVTSDTAVAE